MIFLKKKSCKCERKKPD